MEALHPAALVAMLAACAALLGVMVKWWMLATERSVTELAKNAAASFAAVAADVKQTMREVRDLEGMIKVNAAAISRAEDDIKSLRERQHELANHVQQLALRKVVG